MNEIYKKLTAIKFKKIKFEKVFKKSHFLSQQLIFHCLKNFSKKVNFFMFRSHKRSELRHMKKSTETFNKHEIKRDILNLSYIYCRLM